MAIFCGFWCSDFQHSLYKYLKYFMFYDFSISHGLSIQSQRIHCTHKTYFYSLAFNIIISINLFANNRILKILKTFSKHICIGEYCIFLSKLYASISLEPLGLGKLWTMWLWILEHLYHIPEAWGIVFPCTTYFWLEFTHWCTFLFFFKKWSSFKIPLYKCVCTHVCRGAYTIQKEGVSFSWS